jgi:phosphoglycolate phosphatase
MPAAAKNIVFDWNCTLLDDFQPMFSCTNMLLTMEGVAPVTEHDFRTRYTIPFRQFYDGMGLDAAQVDKLISHENSAFHDHYEPLADRAGLRPGAEDVLKHARQHGVKTLILSNHIVDPIRTQLKRLQVEHLLDEVLAYADRATQFRDMTKGERLRRYMQKGAAAPHTTMIIGDSVEEIDIARDQGLISVAITGGCVSEERLRAGKPDYVIHSLHELKPIMQERGFVP